METDMIIKQSEIVKSVPDGFDIDIVICTTMSIDPSVMIQTIFQIEYPSLSKVKKEQVDIVLGCENKFRFFYDKKESINFENDSCIESALSDCSIVVLKNLAFPVKHNGPIFHPKIILIRFKNKDNESYYRLMVSSKNLTSSYSYEVAVILESIKIDFEKPNHNIADFLNFLTEKSKEDEKIKSIAEEINNYQFVLLNEDCTDREVNIRFSGCNDGLDKQENLLKCLKEKKDEMLILSPSYETKQECIDKYFVYEPKQEKTNAKLYYLTDENILWVGSSNLSEGGLQENVECMVEIHKADGVIKIDENEINVFGTPCVRVTDATTIKPNKAIEILNAFIDDHAFYSDGKKIYINVKVTHEYVGCRFWVKLYDWNLKSDDKWTEIDYKTTNIEIDRKGHSDFLLVGCEYDNTEAGKQQVAKKMISLAPDNEDENVLKGALKNSYKELLEVPWFNHAQKNDVAMREYGMRVGQELINNDDITIEQKGEIRILLDIIEHYYQKES